MRVIFIFVLAAVATAQAARISKKEIPVEVLYDRHSLAKEASLDETDRSQFVDSNRNLDAKHQLPREESSIFSLLQNMKKTALEELQNLKENVEAGALKNTQYKPDEDSWKKLYEDVESNFDHYENLSSKQNNQENIFQAFINGFQNATATFIQNLNRPQNQNISEEEQPGFGQNFINYFQNGVQQIINNLNQFSNQISSTTGGALSDTGISTTPRPGIFSNVVNSVQQFFENVRPNNTNGPLQQFNNVIGNLSQTQKPGNSSGEDQKPAANSGVIQNIGNQISSALGQINPFAQRPQNGGASPNSATSSSSAPQADASTEKQNEETVTSSNEVANQEDQRKNSTITAQE